MKTVRPAVLALAATNLRRAALALAAVAAAPLLLGGSCTPKQKMLLVPGSLSVAVDESFVLTVETRNLANPSAFAFTLSYDPALLQLDGPLDLGYAGGELAVGPTVQAPGTVEVWAAQTTGLPDSTGSGLFLADIPFRALAPGQATVVFDYGETARVQNPGAGNPAVDALVKSPQKNQATITIQ